MVSGKYLNLPLTCQLSPPLQNFWGHAISQHILFLRLGLDLDAFFNFHKSSLLVRGPIFNLFADTPDYLKSLSHGAEVKLYFSWHVPAIADTSSLPWKDKTMFSRLGLGPVFDLYII